MIDANEKIAMVFHLSGGGCHDSPQGRKLLESQGSVQTNISLLMDRAYKGDNTRDLAIELGYGLCVPQNPTGKSLGGMTMSYTNAEMKWSAFFAVSTLIEGYLLDTTS